MRGQGGHTRRKAVLRCSFNLFDPIDLGHDVIPVPHTVDTEGCYVNVNCLSKAVVYCSCDRSTEKLSYFLAAGPHANVVDDTLFIVALACTNPVGSIHNGNGAPENPDNTYQNENDTCGKQESRYCLS